ncbi:MAG TPA: flagellar basal-body MS-ring/collar protein FliF [Candidatus Methylacidiphilales bacterium]|jgi:flagellar M-ring protein FliF|nr:flagellar basal-body MS-ring/collar protein FliF [Candidatus Methylacidiphilales bacterium]
MDDIKKNLLALWKGLSAQRKVSLVASFLLSLAVLGGVVYLASKPKLTLLYGGMQPAEAQKVVEYLDSKKIDYDVAEGGRSVLVPAAQVYSVRMGLASQGIPTMSDGGVGFELFDKPTFGMSDFMQRANYYRALQGELARTIRQLDEVANARVLIVVPEEKLFGQDHQQAKASVFVQLQPGRSLGDEQVRAIQFLVANGVEGLQPEHVAVIDGSGRAMSGADSDGDLTTGGQLSDKQREARAELESYLQEKAQSMLDQVLGPGQSVVRVASDIDFSTSQETTEKYDPKNSATTQESATTESSSTTSPNSSNTGAGVTANTAGSSDNSNKSNDEKKENTATTYQVGKTMETRIDGGGTIKRLSIALMLNERKGTGPDAKPTARTAEEIKQIEAIVKEAVGFTTDDTRTDSIQTQEVAFADMFDDGKPSQAKTASIQEEVNQYLPYITQGCLVLLAIGILFYFKSVITSSGKKGEAAPDAFESLLHNYTVQSNGGVNVTGGNANPRAGTGGMAPNILTPQELSRLIRENPENASQALKSWLRRN